MSDYQRFIAYVYEYQKSKKGSNCGFLKVEVRKQRCAIEVHLHCPGITPGTSCNIYGFLRKDGLINGFLLGSCETHEDTIECLIETDPLNMGNSGIPLDKMGGMILTTLTGGFYGTEWDDQSIRPENFTELKQPEPTEPSVVPEQPELEQPESEQPESEQPESEQPPETPEHPKSEIQKQSMDLPPAETSEPEEVPTEPAARPEPVPISFGESFVPFTDGEFINARKIHPKELRYFSRRGNALQANRFLQYGYYNFGHLLLAQNPDGQYILGIPGGYNQQERFMAGMFGFPYFKESPVIRLSRHKGGYWYRLINAPDSH